MASVMQFRWEGVTPEQYDEVRSKVGWETRVPTGAIGHTAYFADGALNVVDIWESPADFDRFFEERLGPAVQEAGIQGQPNVTWYQAHAVFLPKAVVGTPV